MEAYQNKLSNREEVDEDLMKLIELLKTETSLSTLTKGTNQVRCAVTSLIKPELSGKLLVLHRMMSMMRAAKQGERIVVVSNYTQTLDLIEQMCR